MPIPEIFLDELIQKNDILDVVGSYVQLTKKTGGNMFGLCPFHSEKTPSFSVNADKQIYHCFGCGKGGGVISFIMEIENLSFPDAVQVLAKRAGLTVPDDTASKEQQSRRARVFELNREAARYFYSVLHSPKGETARAYIAKRGISKAMVTRFGLGAAPDAWDGLYRAMTQKGYTKQELLEAGLVKRSRRDENSVYDAFRNRLMFPVIDVRGSIIGFSGRILDDGEPKYLNSSDTPVFDKSRNLFALNLAKKTKSGMLILTEGNIDVVSLHQAGFDGAVASLGTSLTEEQSRLMSRYAQKVVIAFDADEAGLRASQRAIGLLEKADIDVRVLRMQGAKDPDEFITKYGRDAFASLLDKSENHIDYRLQTLKNKAALDTDDGRLQYLSDATKMLSTIGNALEREIYGAKVAEAAGVSLDAVMNEVKKAFKKRVSAEKKKQERRELSASTIVQPAERALRYQNTYSAVAEAGIVCLLAADGELFKQAEAHKLQPEEFTSPLLGKVYRLLKKRRELGLDTAPASILTELDSAEASHFTRLIEKPVSISNGARAMQDYIDKIRAEAARESAKADPERTLTEIQKRIRENQEGELSPETLQKYKDQSGCGG